MWAGRVLASNRCWYLLVRRLTTATGRVPQLQAGWSIRFIPGLSAENHHAKRPGWAKEGRTHAGT
jgi:hypothetical protein